MLPILEGIKTDLSALRRDGRRESGSTSNKKALRDLARAVGERWFASAPPILARDQRIPDEVVERYSKDFRRLIRINAPHNLKPSYEQPHNKHRRPYRDE